MICVSPCSGANDNTPSIFTFAVGCLLTPVTWLIEQGLRPHKEGDDRGGYHNDTLQIQSMTKIPTTKQYRRYQSEERTPIGHFGEPEELAGGILYLASGASSMVTGHTLVIDGGWLAR